MGHMLIVLCLASWKWDILTDSLTYMVPIRVPNREEVPIFSHKEIMVISSEHAGWKWTAIIKMYVFLSPNILL